MDTRSPTMALRALLSLTVASLSLTGCGRPANYAALLPRPTELAEGDSPASAPESQTKPLAPLPAASVQAISDAKHAAQRGDDAFRALLDPQRKYFTAAQGAAPMSEAWVAAQQALSTLEAARAPTVQALADLDQLCLQARTAGTDSAPIDTARTKVSALVAVQNDALAQLSASLSQIRTPAH